MSNDSNGAPPQRQSIMNVKRASFLDTVKQKCMARLTEHRRSAIHKKRQEQMHILTESKMKNGYIEKQVYDEMAENKLIQGMIQEELNEMAITNELLSIDQWNKEFQEICNELNEYFVKDLIERSQYDEGYHYEKYQQLNQLETEQLARIYDSNNNDQKICAICKRYVYRIKGSRVCCERPQCIDIDLGQENFQLEDLMNMIMKIVLEHRESCESNGKDTCQEDKYLKVKVAPMGDVIRCDAEEMSMQGENMALFVSCDCCSFWDFISLY